MRRRRVVVLPEVEDVLRHLPPLPKRKVREALEALRNDPALGEPLERELTGLRRVRSGQLRIVYRPLPDGVEVLRVGPRRTIYLDLERERRMASAHRPPRQRASTGGQPRRAR